MILFLLRKAVLILSHVVNVRALYYSMYLLCTVKLYWLS